MSRTVIAALAALFFLFAQMMSAAADNTWFPCASAVKRFNDARNLLVQLNQDKWECKIYAADVEFQRACRVISDKQLAAVKSLDVANTELSRCEIAHDRARTLQQIETDAGK